MPHSIDTRRGRRWSGTLLLYGAILALGDHGGGQDKLTEDVLGSQQMGEKLAAATYHDKQGGLASVGGADLAVGAAAVVGGGALAEPYRKGPDGVADMESAMAVPGRLGLLRDAFFRRLLALADMTAAACALLVIGATTGRGVAATSLAAVPLIVLLAKLGGRYDHDNVVLRKSTLDEIPQLMVLAAAFALAWSAVAFVAGVHMELRGAGVVALWAFTAALIVVLRACARALAQISAPRDRALIVGPHVAQDPLSRALSCDPAAHVEVVGCLPLTAEEDGATFDELETVVRELDVSRVFLIPVGDSEAMLETVRRSTRSGAKISIVPRLFEVVGSAVEFDTVGGVTVLGVRRPGLSRSSMLIKRTIDVVSAALGLLVLAPFGALVALLIKLDSPGPVFYRQARVGKDGRIFYMLKFRSMINDAHEQQAALAALNETEGIFKLSDDPRVTRVGRFLRRSSIDELPQLINVFLGEMSLVGPRPLVADEDALIDGRHRDRLELTPGMTGLWQVLGPNRPPLTEMVKTDYLYAANWSLWNDTKILLRTFSHMFARRGC